jgi:hypothetical protein
MDDEILLRLYQLALIGPSPANRDREQHYHSTRLLHFAYCLSYAFLSRPREICTAKRNLGRATSSDT